MIKLRDLQYLDAIDRHKHFGRAAEACFVSQPTLSAQIMKLEEYVGFSLVERHRRNVMLTPQGAALVLQARKVLKSAQEFEDAARALSDPLAGDFKIGMIPTLAPYLLPHIMQGLTEALPKVNHFLYEKQTHDLLADLDKGDLDLLVLPWLEEMDRFERYTVMTEPLLLAVHPQHRLARRKSVTLDDLRDETVLTLEDGHCLRDQAMGYCFSAGADEDKRFQATSLETLRYMVASGSGITLLPRLATLNQPDSGLIRYLPFKKPAPEREITIVIRPHYPRMDCVRAIVSSVRESIAALQAANKL